MTHHYLEECNDEDETMAYCDVCECDCEDECGGFCCDCDTLGSQDTWSTEEDATTSDEEFIAPEGSVHTEEKPDDEDDEEEDWDFDEEDTDETENA
jgi:hypothetical protein